MLVTTLAMLALAYRCLRAAPVPAQGTVRDGGVAPEQAVPVLTS